MVTQFKRPVFWACGLALILAGCTSQHPRITSETASPAQEKRLGTAWGENVSSRTVSVEATRLSDSPPRTAAIYYSGGNLPSQATAYTLVPLGDVEMRIQDDNGKNLKITRNSRGDHQLFAREGDRYQLTFYNRSRSATYEVVSSVDGLDVLTGQPGSLERRGYLLYPRTTLRIEGFRKSQEAVAAFRFAQPDAAYAANSLQGDVANVGVIGAAVFTIAEEKLPDCQPQAWPDNGGYAPPPCRK